jgi:alpha-1,2-glucosyltransferase
MIHLFNKKYCKKPIFTWREYFFWVFVVSILITIYIIIRHIPFIIDEKWHFGQIKQFQSGNFKLDTYIAVFPTYHFITAAVLWLCKSDTLQAARYFSLLIAIFNAITFYALSKEIYPQERYVRTLQFVFLPLIFPYHFLVYTEGMSLLFVLISIYLALRDKPLLSALIAILAVSIRATNIFWAGFSWLLLLFPTNNVGLFSWTRFRSLLMRTWIFPLIFIAFSIFIWLNHGVAIGDRNHHNITLNLSNVFYYLMMFSVLFFPDCIKSLYAVGHLVCRKPIITTLMGGILSLIYWKSYKITHHYNDPARYWAYMRNRILFWTTHFPLAKGLCLIPTFLGISGLTFTQFQERRFKILIPITILSIIVMPLIELRYYIIPGVLFLLFRKSNLPGVEYFMTILYLVISICLLSGIISKVPLYP